MGERMMPAEAFPPGDYMRDEMEARGWSVAMVAERMKVEPSLVEALLSADASVTPREAFKLHRCFGVDPQTWLNLEDVYRWWLSRRPATT